MRWILAVATILAGAVLMSCGEDGGEEETMADAEALYAQNCARCHQIDGQGFGDIYPSLAGNPIVVHHDTRPLERVIRTGSGGMPGFAGSFSSDELEQVVSYIRSNWSNEELTHP